MQSKYKYDGGNELEDAIGLNYYTTFYRNYDAQIGRFTGVDPLAEKAGTYSPYHYGLDNPNFFSDPSGALSDAEWQDALDAIFGDDADSHPNGGTWGSGGGGGGGYFGSQDEAFGYAATYMTQNRMWGGQPGWATSFNQALNTYTQGGNQITLGMVQGYGEEEYGDNFIAANYAGGVKSGQGFDIRYAGNSYSDGVSGDLSGVTVASQFISNASMMSLFGGSSGSDGWDISGGVFGTLGLGYDLTTHGIGALANTFRGTAQLLNIEEAGLQIGNLGELTVEVGSKALAGVAVAVPIIKMGYNLATNNPNADYWKDGTDAVMAGVAFIPVVGWAISGTYFISNIIVEHCNNGKSIGDFIGQGYNSLPKVDYGDNGPPAF